MSGAQIPPGDRIMGDSPVGTRGGVEWGFERAGILWARYRSLILGCVIGFVIVAAAGAMIMPKTYPVTAKILVVNKRLADPGGLDPADGTARYDSPDEEDLFTEIEVLRSYDLVAETVKALRQSYIDDAGRAMPEALQFNTRSPQAAQLAGIVEDAADTIETEVVPGAYVIDVVFPSSDVDYAQGFLQTYLETYLRLRRQLLEDEGATLFLTNSRAFYRDRLDELEAQLSTVQEGSRVGDLVREKDLVFAELAAEQAKLTALADSRLLGTQHIEVLESEMRRFRADGSAGPVYLPPELRNEAIDRTQIELAEAARALAVAQDTYRRGSESLAAARARYQQQRSVYRNAIETLITGIRNEVSLSDTRVAAAEDRIAELSARGAELERLVLEQNAVLNEKEAVLGAFIDASSRQDTAAAANAGGYQGFSNVRILQPPTVPSSPDGPSLPLMALIGAFLGALVASAIIFVREATARYVSSTDDVEDLLFGGPAPLSTPS